MFKEIIGESGIKPFECVGSYKEARYAISKTINNYKGELPILLKYYQDNYPLDLEANYESFYNNNHNLPLEYEERLKRELDKYV